MENRQITIEPIIGPPRLFGIYPQNVQFSDEHARENTMQGVMQFSSNPSTLNFDENSQENQQDCDKNSHLVKNKFFSHMKSEQFPKESSNDNYNSKTASSKWTDYFDKLLSDNMRHQWTEYYHTYTPSYTSISASQPPTLETLYANLLHKYKMVFSY